MDVDGSLALQLEALEKMIGNSETFRALAGVTDPEFARRRVYWHSVATESFEASTDIIKQTPYCVIKPAEHGTNIIGQGVAIDLVATWGHLVGLTWSNPAEHYRDHQTAIKSAYTTAGLFVDELIEQSGVDEYGFQNHEMPLAPTRTPFNERDRLYDLWTVVFRLGHEVDA